MRGARRGGEEPERVEVRAVHGLRLDDGVGAGGAQPQRHRGVPRRSSCGPVDHRPLVQPEAAEPGGAGGGGGQQGPDERRGRAVAAGERGRVERDRAVGPADVPGDGEELLRVASATPGPGCHRSSRAGRWE